MSDRPRSESPRNAETSFIRTRGRDDPQPVARQQHEVVGRDHVDVAAPHPGDGRAEPLTEVQVVDRAPGQLLVGQRDPPEVQVPPVGLEHVRGAVPEVARDGVDDVARADDRDEVPGAQGLVVLRDEQHVVGLRLAVHDTREDDVAAVAHRRRRRRSARRCARRGS